MIHKPLAQTMALRLSKAEPSPKTKTPRQKKRGSHKDVVREYEARLTRLQDDMTTAVEALSSGDIDLCDFDTFDCGTNL